MVLRSIYIADISNAYRTAFTPAGYAFSIWGLIYSLGAAFVIYQSFLSQLRMVNYLSYWFVINMIANGLWLICFSNELGKMWVSVIVMFVFILVPLLMLYRKLNPEFHPLSPVRLILRRATWTQTSTVQSTSESTSKLATMLSVSSSTYNSVSSESSSSNFWGFICYNTFISVYLGWICVASIANTAIALTPRNNIDNNLTVGSLSLSDWSIIMQIVATILALLMLLIYLDVATVGPIAWALIAINKQQQSPNYPGNGNVVSISSILGWGLVVLCSITIVIRTVAWYKYRNLYGNSTGSNGNGSTMIEDSFYSKHIDEDTKEESITTPLT